MHVPFLHKEIKSSRVIMIKNVYSGALGTGGRTQSNGRRSISTSLGANVPKKSKKEVLSFLANLVEELRVELGFAKYSMVSL